MVQMKRESGLPGVRLSMINPFAEARRRLSWYDRTMMERAKASDSTSWDAEELVDSAAGSYRLAHSTFQNVRIPDPSSGNRKHAPKGEVDVVLVTERGIALIEVKNWKGSIESFEDENGELDLFQPKVGTKPVVSKLREKCEMLKRMATSRFSDFAGEVFPLVVLTHNDGEPDQKVSRMNTVCALTGRLNRRERDLHKALDTLFKGLERTPQNHIRRMAEMFESFGTWDTLHYDGGGVAAGDFSSIPEGWSREETRSISIEVVGGRIATLLRGPRFRIRSTGLDGTVTEKISGEGPEIGLYEVGVWRTVMTPLEHLKSIEFGYSEPVDWSSVAKGETSASDQSPLSRFEVGKEYVGTIVAQLGDPIHGILVSLVANQVVGLLPTKGLSNNVEMLEHFYSKGNQLTVRIEKIDGPKRILLSLAE